MHLFTYKKDVRSRAKAICREKRDALKTPKATCQVLVCVRKTEKEREKASKRASERERERGRGKGRDVESECR